MGILRKIRGKQGDLWVCIFSVVLVLFLSQPLMGQQTEQVNINKASRSEVRTLPISRSLADSLYLFRIRKGYFESIYEILDAPGMDSETFERIKPLILITLPEERREVSKYILYLQERFASEESPREGAIDECRSQKAKCKRQNADKKTRRYDMSGR